MKPGQIITALDIGTTKICAIIGQITNEYKLDIRGIGISESSGLDRGVVKDIARASDSIRQCIKQAEEEAGFTAQNIYAGIAGEHIKSMNVTAKLQVSNSINRQDPIEITQEHVDRIIAEAKSVLPRQDNHNLEIIHAIPQFYDIDDQKGVLNPIAMSGFQLVAHVHIVMANVSALRNIQKCIELTEYEATEIVLEPIASAKAVLNDDEYNLGCILLDIGGGTTDIAVFYKDSIRFTSIKPVGGANVTHDIAIGLRTPLNYAEKLKVNNGSAVASKINDNEMVKIESIGGKVDSEKKLRFVAEIIEYRMKETLEIAYKSVINAYHKDLMTAGLVLTGGASLLKHIDQLAYDVFNMPVKIGYPNLKRIAGQVPQLNDPKYATSIGLLYYGLDIFIKSGGKVTSKKNNPNSGKLISKIKKFFTNISEYI